VKHYKVKSCARQAGMTLIELTVVLLILVGLAGLLIPYVAGFVEKTHDSTGANSIAELDNTLLRHKAQTMRYPDKMESLINGVVSTSTTAGDPCLGTGGGALDAVNCKMMNTAFLEAHALAGHETHALHMAGIESVFDNDPNTADATFASNGALTARGLANAGFVAALKNDTETTVTSETLTVVQQLHDAFGGDINRFDQVCNVYAVFGIGDKSSLIGKSMQSAPVHFASEGSMGPASKYNRFVAVFEIPKDGTSATVKAPGGVADADGEFCHANHGGAKLIGSAMVMPYKAPIGLASTLKWNYDGMAKN
jgi:type II secretory pathway pseudopilin PulG